MEGTYRRWIYEAIWREKDTDSGSQIVQLTSASIISTSIYNETPYYSAKCNRLVLKRFFYGTGYYFPCEIWVANLENKNAGLIQVEESISILGVAQSGYNDDFYYLCKQQSSLKLFKLSLSTLKKEVVWHSEGKKIFRESYASVSPDGRYFIFSIFNLEKKSYSIMRIDIRTGKMNVIYENPEMVNLHILFEPKKGENILVQLNRGSKTDKHGNVIISCGKIGATLFVIDKNGKNRRNLPVARPHIPTSASGHECWIGHTGKVLLTTLDPWFDGKRKGNVLTIRPGKEKPSVVAVTNWRGGHISASKDGHFWVCDPMDSSGYLITVGSIYTGRYRTLCRTHSSPGRPEYTHAHPYITSDNKWVIFSSERTGVPQVYMASIPQGFLESLQ